MLIRLTQYSSNGKIRRVCFQSNFLVWCERGQDWRGSKDPLQFLERLLRPVVPFERFVLPRELCQRCGDTRVSLDEPSIIIGKSKEGLYVLDACWCRPFQDCRDLLRVHRNSFRFNHIAKKRDFLLVEVTLFWLEPKTCLPKSRQDVAYILSVLLLVCRIHKDVIQVGDTRLVQVRS